MPDPVIAWADDIHLVRGNVSQLQATFNQLVTKTPTVVQYKKLISTYGSPEADKTTEAPHILEKLRSIIHSPQVKVAVRLKSLYDRGYLPFFLGLSRINFRSQKCDRFVGYVLDYNPPKKDHSDTFPHEGDFMGKPQGDQDTVSYPPALPPIENQLLLKLVFTDKSLRQPSDFLELEYSKGFHDYNNNHNRKLLLRGQAILDLALTDILDESFPKAHEDDLAYLKYRLTATALLAKLAYSYNFADAIFHQIPQDASVDEKLVIFRHVFLAYIGGMSKLAYTLLAIRLWISRLYEPLLSRLQLDQYKTQFKNVYTLAFAELNFMFRRVNNLTEEPTKRIKYEFKTLDCEDLVACQLIVSGVQLGIGTGTTLDDAKQKAAHATFETPKLREQLMVILVTQFRKPRRDRDDAGTAQNGNGGNSNANDDDEAYSPGISAEEYEPERPPPSMSNTHLEDQKHQPVSVPTIDYGEWPPKTDQQLNYSNEAINGVEMKTGGDVAKPVHQTPSYMQHVSQPAPQPLSQPVTQPHARMPLPYGKLPPIPNMKKKGNKSL